MGGGGGGGGVGMFGMLKTGPGTARKAYIKPGSFFFDNPISRVLDN